MSTKMTRSRNQGDGDGISEDLIIKICKQQSEMISTQIDEKFEKMEQFMSNFVSQVKNNTKKITYLENIVDTNEQHARLMNLRVYGLQEAESETYKHIEDSLLLLFKNKLKLDVSCDEIDRCYRVGVYKRGKIRPVLVRFNTLKIRSKIFNNKKYLKNTGFVIKEDLTQLKLELLKSTIAKYGAKNVWTQNGRIFVFFNNQKKAIQTSDDLEK